MEQLLDLTIATQTVLRFQVASGAVQERLPFPWQVAAAPAGASKGANLSLLFNDALLNQDAEVGSGQLTWGASNQTTGEADLRAVGIKIRTTVPA